MTSGRDIILLSLKVAGCATLITVPLGTLLGWLFSRGRFRGKTFVEGIVNIPLVLPPVVTGYFLLLTLGTTGFVGQFLHRLFGLELAFTWQGAAIAAAVVALPLMVRAVRVAVDGVNPKLEDAAKVLHAGRIRIFLRVTLPLAIHGIVSGAVLSFGRALGEFGATIVFAGNIPEKTQTIPLAIFTFLNQPDGEAKSRGLILVSIALAYLSILVNELLLKRVRHHA